MQIKSNYSQAAANQADGAIANAVAAAEGVASGVTNEFHNFVADMEDLVSKTTSLTGEDLARAKAKISARVDAAKDSVREYSDALAQRARKTATETNNYVHEQPWTAIGIGAAVGVLLGFVLARRK